ncbi:MAG: OmpA family protein [Desulfuromusa sp.]|nr:OmpA family protein [Desulfuromusa sp.]
MSSAITIFVLLIIAFILGYLLRFVVNQLTGRTSGKIWGLMILALIIWLIISVWLYVCKIKNQCGAQPETVQISQPLLAEPTIKKLTEPIAALPEWPLYFNWGSATPQLGDGFDAFKQQLFTDMPEGNNLKVTGFFGADEINNTDFSDLGLARAYNVRELLADSLSDLRIERERMKLVSEEFSHPDWKADHPFDLVKFSNMAVSPPLSAGNSRFEYQQSFYFETNSTQSDEQIELTGVMVDQINSNLQLVELVGHADSVGDETHNQKLALLRADAVKMLLIKLGVKSDLISVSSKGEGLPTASNTSSEGRKLNRRVEVTIK